MEGETNKEEKKGRTFAATNETYKDEEAFLPRESALEYNRTVVRL